MSVEIFTTEDVWDEAVTLPEQQWQQHILVRHPEVGPYLAQIEDTVHAPDCVFSSEVRSDAKIFYKRHSDTGAYRQLYLKVVVGYDESPAMVLTAYFCPHITGGKLLWIKTSL
jgi:hypothetical protein